MPELISPEFRVFQLGRECYIVYLFIARQVRIFVACSPLKLFTIITMLVDMNFSEDVCPCLN